MSEIIRENDFLIKVPKSGPMEVDAFIFAREGIKVEPGAVEQLRAAASLPSVAHALGMPDIHHGYGVPIGAVVATRDVVVPAAVGYDINCGMRTILTDLPEASVNVRELAESISRDIPLGEGKDNVRLSRPDFEAVLEGGLAALAELGCGGHRAWEFMDRGRERSNLERVEDRGSMEGNLAAVPEKAIGRAMGQLGTLGGGNHFIELQKVERVFDEDLAGRMGIFKGQLAIMIHSGSRALGHEIGGHYMKLARGYDDARGLKSAGAGLAYLPLDSAEARDYIGAMRAAANFAFANRALMGILAEGNLLMHYPDARPRLLYDVPHNMAKPEEHGGNKLWVHRKGGTRAFGKERMRGTVFAGMGQPVLIPGSMGTASYVLAGADAGGPSLFSVNHGAGRVMSRTAAAGRGRGKKRGKAQIGDDEFKRSMKGIHLIAADKRAVKEEAPQAYKNIDLVIETVREAGLAAPVARLVPRAVLKG